jgi:hypothetical protein
MRVPYPAAKITEAVFMVYPIKEKIQALPAPKMQLPGVAKRI